MTCIYDFHLTNDLDACAFQTILVKNVLSCTFSNALYCPLREPNIWLPSELSSKHTRIPFGNLKDLSIFCICQLLGTL